MRRGLVIQSTGRRDFYIALVDDVLWNQIISLPKELESNRRLEIIEWLCCDDPTVDAPNDAPARQGFIVKAFYTQNCVIEHTFIDGVAGVLTLP